MECRALNRCPVGFEVPLNLQPAQDDDACKRLQNDERLLKQRRTRKCVSEGLESKQDSRGVRPVNRPWPQWGDKPDDCHETDHHEQALDDLGRR
mgnify:CR=1 FL=1